MRRPNLQSQLAARLHDAQLGANTDLLERCVEYLRLLSRWNRRINLTAFDLEAPTDAALDRLILEPIAAARFVRSTDRIAVDIGSGGGSPSIPLKLAAPSLRMVLFEARSRKAAFLREAVRALGLVDVGVETARFGEDALARPLLGSVDLVTIRGVRMDPFVWRGVDAAVVPNGRLFAFGQLVIQPMSYVRQGWSDSSERLWSAGPTLLVFSRESESHSSDGRSLA